MHRKHPGSGWRAQGRYCLLSPSVRRIRLRLGEGRHALYSPKMRLLLLATSRQTEVWKRCHPAFRTGGGSPTACGILDRRLSGGWARVKGGNPSSGIQLAHTHPLGAGHLLLLPPPLHRSLHGRTQSSGSHIPARTQTPVSQSSSALAFCRGPGMRPPHYPGGPSRAAPDGCPLGTQASGSRFSLRCPCLETIPIPAPSRRPRPAAWPHLPYLVPGFSPMVRAPAARPVRGTLAAS